MDITDADNSLTEVFKELTEDSLEFEKRCTEITEDITSDNDATIVKLIEDLRDFLIDKSPSRRAYGLSILTRVLKSLPKNHLNSAQLEFIVAFYTDRLKDHHQVVPVAIDGLAAICGYSNFPEGGASKILVQLFHNVACQQQLQPDRRNIYTIFDTLLTKAPDELLPMGLDYVYGVISAIDQERDPKNLLFLFGWVPKFLNAVNLGHLTEEMFDVLACYFPVDFKSPPKEPNGISRELLADALCPCLCAVPDFAEFCLPLALEKLESDHPVAKLDSLKLIEHGCVTFEASAYAERSTEIWSQLHRTVITTNDQRVEESSLATLRAFLQKLAQSTEHGGQFRSLLKDVTDTLRGNLFPDSKLYPKTAKLLSELIAASGLSCGFVQSEIGPVLANAYNISSKASDKALVLRTLVDFAKLAFAKWGDRGCRDEAPLLCLKASLDASDDLKTVAYRGLAKLSELLSLDCRTTIYENFKALMEAPLNLEVRIAVLECFERLAFNYPEEVETELLNELNTENLELYLTTIGYVVANKRFTSFVVSKYVHYLKVDFLTTLKCLKAVVLTSQNETVYDCLIKNGLTGELLQRSKTHALEIDNNHEDGLRNLISALSSLLGFQKIEQQKRALLEELSRNLNELKPYSNVYVAVLCGYCLKLKRGAGFVPDYETLLEIVLRGEFPLLEEALQLLANCLNKCENEEILEGVLSSIETRCDGLLERGENVANAALTLTWVTKGLVQKDHEKAVYFTDKLIRLLEEGPPHPLFARAFKVILIDTYASLSPTESHCFKSLLYRQKFFVRVSDKLSSSSSCLSAFGCLVEAAPRQVVLLQLPKIYQLIVLTLDRCEESSTLCVILDALRDFIANRETFLVAEQHPEDLVGRFVVLAQNHGKSMKVRTCAIRCLECCTMGFPLYKLLPLKNEVVAALGKCIDDKKRVVRKHAAKARSLWFLLDAPI